MKNMDLKTGAFIVGLTAFVVAAVITLLGQATVDAARDVQKPIEPLDLGVDESEEPALPENFGKLFPSVDQTFQSFSPRVIAELQHRDGLIPTCDGKWKIKVGMRIKFVSEKQRYTIQACNGCFAICTKPLNVQKTVLYTIVDFKQGIRGPENLVFGHGSETRQQCEDMLERLMLPQYPTSVSERRKMTLDIERIDPPKESHGR